MTFCFPQSPPKGITVPYRPMKPGTVNGLGGQAASAAQQAASMVGQGGHAAFLPQAQAQANQNAAVAAAAAAAAINQAAAAASLVPVSQVCPICHFIPNFPLLVSVPAQRCHNPLSAVTAASQ